MGALGSGSERGRRANGTCSVQRPKSWSAAQAAPVRHMDAEGITAPRAPAFAPPMAGMRVRHWTPVRAAPPVRPPSLLTHSLAPAFWPRPHKQICMDRGFAPTPIPNPLIGGVKRVSLGTLKQRAATATHSPLQALLAFRENILRNPCAARVCRSPAHFLCAVWRARAL